MTGSFLDLLKYLEDVEALPWRLSWSGVELKTLVYPQVQLRGTLYAAAFLVTIVALGLTRGPWVILGAPAAMLIGYAFGGLGMAATTWIRSFVHFDYINLALIPLFLFSATFFPLSLYPEALQWIVRATPLYQGVALERGLVLGDVGWVLAGHAAYLAALGTLGVWVTQRRLSRLLLP